MRLCRLLYLTLAFTLAAPTLASASPITFSYQGIISNPDPILATTFSDGQLFSGTFTFESTTPDAFPPFGLYAHAITAFSFVSGSYTASLGVNPQVGNIISVVITSGADAYTVHAPLSGPSVNGVPVLDLEFILYDFQGLLFASEALPLVPPDISLVDQSYVSLGFGSSSINGLPQYSAGGTITDLGLAAPIPEPETYAMMLVGLGLLAGVARRRNSAA